MFQYAAFTDLHTARDPRWLRAPKPVYGNDFTGVRRGDFPWILGGHDVSAPNRRILTAYQANDYLIDFTVGELRALYVKEDIRLGSGPTGLQELSSRHILEGGWALFTPQRFSMGYKRLMFSRHPAYQPSFRRVRDLARQFAVPEHGTPKEPGR
ncbi:MAG: hypothetical protein O6941_02625 [Planctomycetota bacterium]|nr:hypothetical protein [Planctomycetota bacterium]MCZ6611505.1 hypothetical protein [Planctomycetota bacterium]MCZ6811447.1 hypothetical protein [Planctomycetota bacterium]MCZ6850923.1 hypothetical protein [Planctomycetota bacterium]